MTRSYIKLQEAQQFSSPKINNGFTMIFSSKWWKYILLLAVSIMILVIYFRAQEWILTICPNCIERNKNDKQHSMKKLTSILELPQNKSYNVDTDLDHLSARSDIDWDRVFYNRVPKCGSSSVQDVIRKLSRKLHFYYKTSFVYSPYHLVNQSEGEFLNAFLAQRTPFLYDRHLHFVDFTKSGHRQPVYINFIRDPFERIVSGFYYLKLDARRAKRRFTPERFNMTFDECIAVEHPDCVGEFNTWKEIPFFCGHDQICKRPSVSALELAKKNIMKYYLVVGTTEQMEETFHILETLLPSFFYGSAEIYRKMERKLHVKYRGKGKKTPSNESRQHMMKYLDLDYRLYRWTKQRLYNIKVALEAKGLLKKAVSELKLR